MTRMARSAPLRKFLAAVSIAITVSALVPSPSAEAFDPKRVKRAIRRAWGGNDRKAIRVARCESGLNPDATSPSGTYLGLWQFSRTTWKEYGGPGNDPRDVSAYKQTVVAWRLFQDRRWAPWPSCGSA